MSEPKNTPPVRALIGPPPLNTCGTPANYPELETWLDKHNARFGYRLNPSGPAGVGMPAIEGWRIGASIVLITFYCATDKQPRGGWDLYTAGDSLDVAKTLADAEDRLL